MNKSIYILLFIHLIVFAISCGKSGKMVELRALSGHNPEIRHIDSLLNCEAGKITVDCLAGEGVIAIKKEEKTTATNCICLHNLTYTTRLPEYGK